MNSIICFNIPEKRKKFFLRAVPSCLGAILLLLVLFSPRNAYPADGPFFITYTHHLEEPGNLEVAMNPIFGKPKNGNPFLGGWTEFEYGTKAWWTTEFYLTGQSTRGEGSAFTGYRIENRFRPLMGQHKINPVLYIEFEHLNESDKALKEVVGFDSQHDLLEPLSETRHAREKEVELKLILGSDFKGWNLSENFIAEKNLAHAPWEFGYALGINRPLKLAASSRACNFCRENFRVGAELYGGLGEWSQFTLKGTSQYLAPVVSWELNNGTSLKVSPTFGLTGDSVPFMIRFGVSYEIEGFGRRIRQWFH